MESGIDEMAHYEIVRGDAGRLDEIEPIWRSLSDHHAALTPEELPVRPSEEGWPTRRRRYGDGLAAGAVMFIAEGPQGVVGFAFARLRSVPDTLDIDRMLDIETVAVLPEARGAGVGSALIEAIEDWASEHGSRYLQVSVRDRNGAARRLYERRGFRALYTTMVSASERGGAIRLRSTTESDLDFVLRLEQEPEAAPLVSVWSRERHQAAIDDADEAHLLIVRGVEPLGFILLAGLQDQNHNVELRRIIVAARGEGIGRTALGLVLDQAFGPRRAHRVWLDVKPENERARRLYETLGFEEEGILRDAFRTEAGYESLILMSILAPDWPATRAGARSSGDDQGAPS